MYSVYWGDVPQNFGDVLTANILKHYGYRYKHTNIPEQANFFSTGSIVRLAKNSVILGSGIIRDEENLDPNNVYEFVRGPLTRARVLACGGDCPEIYGDPALLLPRFCPPSPKKHAIGFVPHYSHRNKYTKQLAESNGWHYINLVNDDPLVPAKEISSCEKILSTSLHGIIGAHAYGIPAAHVTASKLKKLHGDGSKFADYYASVGLVHKKYNWEEPEFTVGNLPDLDKIETIFREYADVYIPA